jgi:hypothetical protein
MHHGQTEMPHDSLVTCSLIPIAALQLRCIELCLNKKRHYPWSPGETTVSRTSLGDTSIITTGGETARRHRSECFYVHGRSQSSTVADTNLLRLLGQSLHSTLNVSIVFAFLPTWYE